MTFFVHDGPGRPLYEAYRAAFNHRQRRAGARGSLPPWKRLKPWHAKVWNDAADNYKEGATS